MSSMNLTFFFNEIEVSIMHNVNAILMEMLPLEYTSKPFGHRKNHLQYISICWKCISDTFGNI